ncbi:MAG: hypothetical protein PHQ50_07145 [Eubacteriales bacterium]|nr:hypothetical protein [Eubacteriales bacterium]
MFIAIGMKARMLMEQQRFPERYKTEKYCPDKSVYQEKTPIWLQPCKENIS